MQRFVSAYILFAVAGYTAIPSRKRRGVMLVSTEVAISPEFELVLYSRDYTTLRALINDSLHVYRFVDFKPLWKLLNGVTHGHWAERRL
jgi:hypothetical protein